MNTILVGYGAHPQSVTALEWTASLAAAASASSGTPPRIVVVSVIHPSAGEYTPDMAEEFAVRRRAEVTDLVARLGLDGVEIVVRDGEPSEQLLAAARHHEADLVVVGHRDSAALGGLGEHGAAETLLREAQVPFVVVNDSAPMPRPTELRFLVGVDGSETNRDAIEHIARIAAEFGAETVPVLSVYTGASTTRDHDTRLVGEAEAREVAGLLGEDQTLHVINEQPVQGLNDAAKEFDCDLIAIGTQGHRSLLDIFAGQFARRMLEHAERAVLIVPHPSSD